MLSPFDILKKQPEGSFCRFEAANDIASAKIRIEELLALPIAAHSINFPRLRYIASTLRATGNASLRSAASRRNCRRVEENCGARRLVINEEGVREEAS